MPFESSMVTPYSPLNSQPAAKSSRGIFNSKVEVVVGKISYKKSESPGLYTETWLYWRRCGLRTLIIAPPPDLKFYSLPLCFEKIDFISFSISYINMKPCNFSMIVPFFYTYRILKFILVIFENFSHLFSS